MSRIDKGSAEVIIRTATVLESFTVLAARIGEPTDADRGGMYDAVALQLNTGQTVLLDEQTAGSLAEKLLIAQAAIQRSRGQGTMTASEKSKMH